MVPESWFSASTQVPVGIDGEVAWGVATSRLVGNVVEHPGVGVPAVDDQRVVAAVRAIDVLAVG